MNRGHWEELTGPERFALLLLLDNALDRNAQWTEFERQLIYENRFSSDNPIVEEIRRQKERAARTLHTGSTFYRARAWEGSTSEGFLQYCFRTGGVDRERVETALQSAESPEALFSELSASYEEAVRARGGAETELSELQKRWRRGVRFKGYSAAGSMPPPADKVGPARANPDHIRYLYLSEDDVTPVYEIRPIIGQTVSVAKFRLLRDLTVYDLTLDEPDGFEAAPPSLFRSIGRMFSRPHSGSAYKYTATQFLAEEIKGLGFDGLRYRSSLHRFGVNLVLFDPDCCQAVSSDLVEVKGVSVETERPLVYGLQPKKEEKRR